MQMYTISLFNDRLGRFVTVCRTIKPLRGVRNPFREGGFLLGDPQGVEGLGADLGTSVTVLRMTDAYGASTLAGATRMNPPWDMITLMLKCVTPVICDPLLNQPAQQGNF